MTASIVVALTLLAGASADAATQPEASDRRWQPWIGCWLAADDRIGTGARTCVAPAPDGGITITTLIGVQLLTTEHRVADDRDHAVAVDDCRGRERTRWSPRGPRVHRSANVTCGTEAPRTLSSLTFMTSATSWVDVQALQQGEQTSVRVQRYRLAGDQRLDGRPLRQPSSVAFDAFSAPWSIDDVLELSAALPPDAVQAAIGEGDSDFRLDKRSLVALADAGVAERVIDLMVGLTYPAHFTVKSGGGSAGGATGFVTGIYDPFYSPILGPAGMYGCYGAYAWAMADYFSDCGAVSPYMMRFGGGYYGDNGYYGYPWYPTTGPPVDPDGGAPSPDQPPGRVVNGRGYTQVTPVDASTVDGGGTSSGQSTSSGGSNNGGSSGASSGGYSSGAAGGGGRMAMPRPPGD